MAIAISMGNGVNVKAASKSLTSSEVANYFLSQVGKSYPSNYCLKFVADAFANMGAARSSGCCAYTYGGSHIASTGINNIPVGADVFFGSCGVGPCSICKSYYCGHIGVYVGNGYFVHATGGTVQKTSLMSAYWKSRYRGWGYHSNVAISQTSSGSNTAGSVKEPFRYNLDQVPADGTVLHSASDSVSFGGWALTTYGNGEGVTCINIIVNGKDVVFCSRNQRDDVAAAFPDYANANAGFNGSVSASLLQPGRNTVALRAYATNANRNDILVSDFGERTIYYEPDCNIESCIDFAKAAGRGKFSVGGWLFDRDSDQTPLSLHIYVGGEAGTPGTPCYIIGADKERRDVAEVYSVGAYHGFSETLVTDRFGEQTLYFYAIDATGTKTKLIGSRPVFIEENKAPVGVFDRATGGIDKITVSGWMYDPDSEDSIPLHIYVDGPAGSGKCIGSFMADKERKDVAKSEHVGDFHGFEEEINIGDLEGEHTFYIHAIDTDGGSSSMIGAKTVNIQQGSSPTGAVDQIKGVKGGISLKGWSADRDAVSKAVTLHVYVGGHIYVIHADKERLDVDKETGLGRFHGFDEMLSVTERGKQEIKVFALDEGSSQPNVLLGQGTVVIEEPDAQEEHIHEYVKEIIRQADCAGYGEEKYSCACGDSFTKVIDKTAHTVVADEGFAATCEEDGITEGSHCLTCGAVITAQEIIAKTGHRNTVVRFQKEADCVCAGYTGDVFCVDCGMKIRDGNFTEQLEHTVGDNVFVIKEPTESEAGISVYTCTVCKTMGVKVIPAVGAERLKEDQSHIHAYIENVIDTEKVPAYYSKVDAEERVQACACGVYIVETIPETDIRDSQNSGTKESEDAEHENNKDESNNKDELNNKDDSDHKENPDKENNSMDENQPDNSNKPKDEIQTKNPFPEKNKTVSSGSCLYKITKSAADGGTVELKAPADKNLLSVNLPSAVSIDGYVFQVTGIGKNAFKNCRKLKKVTIGANVTRIEANAFRNCPRLKKVIVKSERIEYVGKNAWKGIHAKAVIRVPKADRKKYMELLKGKGQKESVKIR